MSYKTIITQDQRLTVLRVLSEDGDYSHNEYVLQEALALFGHKIGTDKLRTELSWLHEQGLIKVDTLGAVWVVQLTRRGDDVAHGRALVPGVKRPRPGE